MVSLSSIRVATCVLALTTLALAAGCRTGATTRSGTPGERFTYQRTPGMPWWTRSPIPPSATTAATFDRAEFLANRRSALAANPRSADVQHNAGESLFLHGELAEGLAALQRAVELEPHEPRWTLSYAAACAQLDRLDEARSALEACRAMAPGTSELAVCEARVCEAQEDWEAAAGLYAAASQGAQGEGAARSWQRHEARCLCRAGNFPAARDAYAACVDPSDAATTIEELTEFGEACLRIDDHRTARIVFDAISRRSPRRLRSVETLRGMCALQVGDLEAAQRITEAALAAWPGDPQLDHLDQLLRAASAEPPARTALPDDAPGSIPFDELDPPRRIELPDSDQKL